MTHSPCPCDAQALRLLRYLVTTTPHIGGGSLRVLVYLLPELLDGSPRLVKQVALARCLGMQQTGVGKAIVALVQRGLLARGENDGRVHTYRLSDALLSHLT